MSSTSANKDHYYASSIGKSRRNSPGDSQGIPFFQTGQGPSYSNAYTAPRSSPGRYDLTPQALYPTQWPTGNSPPMGSAFPNYDMTTSQGRYSPQQPYPYSSRNTPPLGPSPTDPRRLPPLATSSPGSDRWQQNTTYGIPAVPGYTNPAGIRSPAATYAPSYIYGGHDQNNAYDYIPSHDHLMPPHGQSLFDDSLEPLMTRSNSPGYGHSRHSSQMPSSHYNTPPPISPTSPEEPPMVKKKRKRADAAQLKVLNETYARTAFPSTEERHSLAKALDMSARSVQIWFQNKRQSMRQTNRQSNSNVSSSHQPYGLTSAQSERMMEEQMSHGHGHVHGSGFSNPQMPGAETPFMTGGPGQDIPRSHTSHSSSSHRRYRSPEDESHKQWSRGY